MSLTVRCDYVIRIAAVFLIVGIIAAVSVRTRNLLFMQPREYKVSPGGGFYGTCGLNQDMCLYVIQSASLMILIINRGRFSFINYFLYCFRGNSSIQTLVNGQMKNLASHPVKYFFVLVCCIDSK